MNINILSVWKGIIISPRETFGEEKKRAGYETAIMSIGVSSLISSLVLVALMFFVVGTGLPEFLPKGTASFWIPLVMVFLFVFMFLVVYSLMTLVVASGCFAFAKVLGGKGQFAEHFRLFSLNLFVFSVVYLLSWGLSYFSLGQVAFIALGLYYVYLIALALGEIHGFGLKKAVAAVVSFLVALSLLGVVISSAIPVNFQSGHPEECPGFTRLYCSGASVTTTSLLVGMENTEKFDIRVNDVVVPEFSSCEIRSDLPERVPVGKTFIVVCAGPKVPLNSMDKFASEITINYADQNGNEYQDKGRIVGKVAPW